MCKYSAPCFCAMINPCTDTLHKREHICTLLSTFISTSHKLLRKNPVTKKKNWPKVWTILNKIKVTPQITSQSISLISSEILIIPKTIISRLAQEQDIFARSHIALPIFYNNDKQHQLVHLWEMSQSRKKDIGWSSTSSRRKIQTETKRNLRQICMAYIYAMSGGKNNPPIKIEGDGCLTWKDIAGFMKSKKKHWDCWQNPRWSCCKWGFEGTGCRSEMIYKTEWG